MIKMISVLLLVFFVNTKNELQAQDEVDSTYDFGVEEKEIVPFETKMPNRFYLENPRTEFVIKSYINYTKHTTQYNGFAIQIYAGDKNMAMSARSTFHSMYPEKRIKMNYDNVKYIAQYGAFLSRREAYKELLEIRNNFKDAYIVNAKVPYFKSF